MSDNTDDVTGYDPSEVLGWDEDMAGRDVADALPEPLAGVNQEQHVDQAMRDELLAVQAGFRERKEKEAERVELATNGDFWFCVAFATQAQRDAFLAGTKWRDLGLRYLDGRDLARRLGVDLPPDPDWPKPHRDGSWDEFAMTVEENRSIE